MELYPEDYKRLAAYIMSAKLDIPPKQIASVLGMSPSWVYKWKRGFNSYYVRNQVEPCLEQASEYLIEAENENDDGNY
ncbi:MAG: helix-turn-helix domain-containing protein [Thermoguttaceae bacterium]|nr:helix-turn-helix domain-containing protein [Thermoguttaceae bacterium]